MRREQNLALLPQADNPTLTPNLGTSAELAIALLIHYSFDLGGYGATELVQRWKQQFHPNWLHLAVIEALYQGRYKAVSVQQILSMWQRRGQPSFHFNMEFESLICNKFPSSLHSGNSPAELPQHKKQERDQQLTSAPDNGQAQTEEYQHHSNHSFTSKSPTALPFLDRSPFATPGSARLLAPTTSNHPPIEQFTPQMSDRCKSFTEKLKAIAQEEIQDRNHLE